MSEHPKDVSRTRIWDLGLRLFHWSLAFCVICAWYLGEFGPNVMTLHFYFGYAIIALLVFRVVWGLVGPAPARFVNFIYGPRTLFAYLLTLPQRKPSYWPGHNPVGALSVFALLGILILQVSTGLFADPDDYVNIGPLADQIPREARRTATWIHELSAYAILGLVILHLSAIGFYRRFKGEDLITPMITGWKWVRRKDG